jgi:hypothetical protein
MHARMRARAGVTVGRFVFSNLVAFVAFARKRDRTERDVVVVVVVVVPAKSLISFVRTDERTRIAFAFI